MRIIRIVKMFGLKEALAFYAHEYITTVRLESREKYFIAKWKQAECVNSRDWWLGLSWEIRGFCAGANDMEFYFLSEVAEGRAYNLN